MYRAILYSVYIILFTSLFACTGSPMRALQANALTDTLHRYEMTLRWGKIEDAYQLLMPDLLAKSVIPANLDNIKIIQYDIVSAPTIDGSQASQRVEIKYLYQDRQTIRTLVDTQLWTEHPDLGWRRANAIPIFQM